MRSAFREVEVNRVIAKSGSHSFWNQGDPIHLREDQLTDKAKVIYKFIYGRLMHTQHQSEMIHTRWMLVYTIVREGSVDVRNLIHS